MCKGGLAPVAPKCRVVAADADEHERTRSLVTQPVPSKTPSAPSLNERTEAPAAGVPKPPGASSNAA